MQPYPGRVKREYMIGESENVQSKRRQEEIRHRAEPERSYPNKQLAYRRRKYPLHEPASDKRESEHNKNGEIGAPPVEARRDGLQSAGKDVIVDKPVNSEKYGEEDDKAGRFHSRRQSRR